MNEPKKIETRIINRYQYFAELFEYANISFPYKFFERSQSIGGGYHYGYTEAGKYSFVYSERGTDSIVVESYDLDEVMFYEFSRSVMREARRLTVSGNSSIKKRQGAWHPKALELMQGYYPKWVKRLKNELSKSF